MKREMLAIIKKDLRSVAVNKRMLAALWAVPLAFTVLLPSVFLLVLKFAPEESTRDFDQLLHMIPGAAQGGQTEQVVLSLLLNYLMPIFFLMIPIMAASVTAASSFVGEKEKRTLETLLYCPLPLRQIFRAKVLASFLLSMTVSVLSFVVMLLVVLGGSALLLGWVALPGVQWLPVMLLVSPAVSLIAITLIVRVSARAKSMEDAQQGAVFLILPILLLLVGQFTGVLLINLWVLLALGALCALLALLLFRQSLKNFQYETLLK